MAPSLEKKAALWVLATSVAVALFTTLSGYWDGMGQDAQAQSLDAVAEAEQINLQAIYAATGSPAPSPPPLISDYFWSTSPFDKSFLATVSGRRLPARTDVKGWAAVRNYYGQLANEDRVALLFLTLAIALFAAAVSIGAAFLRRLMLLGRFAFLVGIFVGLLPIVQVLFGF